LGVVVGLYFFFYTAIINQAFFFTVFFSKAKIASFLFGILYLAGSLIYLAGCDDKQCDSRNMGLSVFP